MFDEVEINRKLDRVVQLLEGEKDAPGIVSRLATVERAINGDNKYIGIQTKVTVMWRAHIWLLCTFSAVAGYALKTITASLHLFGLTAWLH